MVQGDHAISFEPPSVGLSTVSTFRPNNGSLAFRAQCQDRMSTPLLRYEIPSNPSVG